MDSGLQKRQSQSQLHSFNKVLFSAPYVQGTVLGNETRALSKVTVPGEVIGPGEKTIQQINSTTEYKVLSTWFKGKLFLLKAFVVPRRCLSEAMPFLLRTKGTYWELASSLMFSKTHGQEIHPPTKV